MRTRTKWVVAMLVVAVGPAVWAQSAGRAYQATPGRIETEHYIYDLYGGPNGRMMGGYGGFGGGMGGYGGGRGGYGGGMGGMLIAEQDRPYIGIQLDPNPPSELLAKHLGFEPGQGLVITNVAADSPADEVGLERDDIIIEFQGKPVRGLEAFVERVRGQEIGQEVELVVIHEGDRRPVHLKLARMRDRVQWKYPFEPQMEMWSPGRVFRIPPGQDDWIEIPFDQMPDLGTERRDVRRFLQEIRTYHHVDDQGELTVTIVGDPRQEDSALIVESQGTRIETTIGKLDKLPDKFRDRVAKIVTEAAEQAEKRSRRDRVVPQPPLDVRPPQLDLPRWREFMEDMERRIPRLAPAHRDKLLDELRERMDRLDDKLEGMLERLRERPEEMVPGLTPSDRHRLIEEMRRRMDRITEQMHKMQQRQEELFDRLHHYLRSRMDDEFQDRFLEPKNNAEQPREPAPGPGPSSEPVT
ncbi:MAG TPA: PDZ domain-containing protein [Phycisphaerales bacterium]|nr:PDZ domain-containing protein [Phycisphaerales bacterium]